eukprot:3411855-Amphidinium_carterae.1
MRWALQHSSCENATPGKPPKPPKNRNQQEKWGGLGVVLGWHFNNTRGPSKADIAPEAARALQREGLENRETEAAVRPALDWRMACMYTANKTYYIFKFTSETIL